MTTISPTQPGILGRPDSLVLLPFVTEVTIRTPHPLRADTPEPEDTRGAIPTRMLDAALRQKLALIIRWNPAEVVTLRRVACGLFGCVWRTAALRRFTFGPLTLWK